MRFVYPSNTSFTRVGFLRGLYAANFELEYSSLLEELEMKTIDRAIELAIERGLVTNKRSQLQASQNEMLRELNKESNMPVYSIIPLNSLAELATLFEGTIRYNQYATAIQSTMQKLGAQSVYFASEDGDRIPLRILEDPDEDLQDIIQLVKSLWEIDKRFDREQCQMELLGLRREELGGLRNDRPEDITNDEWLITLNEAANDIAVELIKSLRAKI